ncbi:MAG: crotonase/enoyl-CoA hydratase family protein [Bacteroidetes bacterium]|nr:MAG: crotonase/enoyl-CoA hydratase family protein [Bacteroidota bacterium]TAG85917.1 MAG: crotonase/enoyl-CoA hydratase family protein [Bacteroidota bacterium]
MKTLLLKIENKIATLSLHNPEKANAMTPEFWIEMKNVMQEISENPTIRVVILVGEGKHFSSGIDLTMFAQIQQMMTSKDEQGRVRERLRKWILGLQDAFTAIEKCSKPVIAAVHGACIGGAIDMITACDMRFCTEDAVFCVKEIDLGIVADVGTLQRLPKIVSEGIAKEWAYTGKNIDAKEAKEFHLVNQYYANQTEMMLKVEELATTIAKKSPLSIRGTKEVINYTRNHSTEDSLNYVATWNAAMLFSQDAMEAAMAKMQKREPIFLD